MNISNNKQIIQKLGFKDSRGCSNILQNKELCARILSETPMKLNEYAELSGLSKHTIISLLESKKITGFQNVSGGQSSFRFVFKEEADNYLLKKYLYKTDYIYNLIKNEIKKK